MQNTGRTKEKTNNAAPRTARPPKSGTPSHFCGKQSHFCGKAPHFPPAYSARKNITARQKDELSVTHRLYPEEHFRET